MPKRDSLRTNNTASLTINGNECSYPNSLRYMTKHRAMKNP